MEPRLYPSARSVPICVRSSSIMRVMVVEQTSAAMRKKKMGKSPESFSTMVESLSNET